MMRPHSARIRRTAAGILLAGALGVAPAADSSTEWTLKSVFKQIDRATKDVRFVTAEVEWVESFEQVDHTGSGKIWVDLLGRFRGEVAGDDPRTVLIVTPAVHLYRPQEKKVEVFDTILDKDMVLKYVLLGFQPRGSDLKRSYDVDLVREDELPTGKALLFTLDPKLLKKAEPTISGIMLWIDQATWLPAQLVVRREGGQQITVRYGAMKEQQELPAETFLADWPADTAVITER